MQAETDHQIVALGHDRMHLCDNATGSTHVVAERVGDKWVVSAPDNDSVEAVSVKTRLDAVHAMIDRALAALPGTGYSTAWHPALSEMP